LAVKLIVIISNFRGVLIVKLRRGQKLHLQAIARKGLERTMPNGPQTFMYDPADIRINQEFMETLTLEEKQAGWIAALQKYLTLILPPNRSVCFLVLLRNFFL
jgi:hypothetical protein